MDSELEMQQAVPESPAELPSLISIHIPLQIDNARASELSSNQQNTLIQERIPRKLIIEDLGKTAFKAQILDYRLGAYNSKPACLIIFRFVFADVPSRQTISKAIIKVTFDDRPVSGNPNRELRPQIKRPREPGPVYLGREEAAERECGRWIEFGAGIGAPIQPSVNIGLNLGRQQRAAYSSRQRAKISSVSQGDPPWGIVWKLEQNPITKNGVAWDFTQALVVEHTESRRFCAFVKVSAEIDIANLLGLGTWTRGAVWGGNDDPVYFDPPAMAQIADPVMIGDKVYNLTADFAEEDVGRFTRILFMGEEGHPFTVI
ncbi:MAG: hypothetical protein M1840_002024 [Geoglossum simile]|nr:MAG: hypothetical protein M1840_002024 [Geoglossum simile]